MTYRMFGVKIQPHRSFLLFLIIFCSVILFFVLSNRRSKSSIKKISVENDEEINLIDLFHHSFQLVQQAGQTIKLLKNKKEDFKKKAFINLPSEPVTIADLVSHTILTNGLKKKFQNLQIVSEEKDSISNEQFQSIQKEFQIKEKIQHLLPKIENENNLMTVPLSSVAVWIDPLDATKEFTEDLTQYIMVMLCVTIEKQPTIGILYSPFTDKITWGWVGVNHSVIKRDENSLLPKHTPNVDEITISRSHAGQAHEILKKIYHDKQYRILPSAGSGYKTVQVLEEYADYYLHITAIKKWDLCAPDAVLRANHGTMTTLLNQTISYDHQNKDMLIQDGLLVTYKRNHNEILKFLKESNLTKYMSQKKKSN
ncbi:hypothetical protein I4U23_027701 [Adineta vaga]|nr:hypothetical protein I4U23_027701 [Adineta vaga]